MGNKKRKYSCIIVIFLSIVISFFLGVYCEMQRKHSLNEEAVVDNKKYPVNEMSLSEVARLVRIEAEGIASLEYECAAALSAMEYTHSNISGYTTRYVQDLDEYINFEGSVAERAQYFSYGFCRSKALVMKEILNYLGIECREISFWHIRGEEDSHACLEVKWDGKWHFFDPTYGLYFGEDVSHILSWQEISELPADQAYNLVTLSNSSLANSITEFRGGYYDYIKYEKDVGIDGNSTIPVDPERTPGLLGSPAFIGMDINSNDALCEVEYMMENLSAYQRIDIVFDWTTCEKVILETDSGEIEEVIIDKNSDRLRIDLGNWENQPDSLIIRTGDKTQCNYIHISSIEFYKNKDKNPAVSIK